jgi:hypothetical protein
VFDFLVSGETVLAGGTFTAAADGRPFTRGARIYHLIILTTALRATHKTTSNCGWLFLAHKALWRQGRSGKVINYENIFSPGQPLSGCPCHPDGVIMKIKTKTLRSSRQTSIAQEQRLTISQRFTNFALHYKTN